MSEQYDAPEVGMVLVIRLPARVRFYRIERVTPGGFCLLQQLESKVETRNGVTTARPGVEMNEPPSRRRALYNRVDQFVGCRLPGWVRIAGVWDGYPVVFAEWSLAAQVRFPRA